MAGKIYYCEQGTEEWFNVRLGKVTASRVVDILKGAKGKYLASRKVYMEELLGERLTGKHVESYQSEPMKWGTKTEPLARGAFEAITGKIVETVGFVDHPKIPNFGCSPDGLILQDEEGLEIKCPNTTTHLGLIRGGAVKRNYIIQENVGMMCMEFPAWNFVDYDPRLPPGLDFYHQIFKRDDTLVSEIEKEVVLFLAELDSLEKSMRERVKRNNKQGAC